MAILMACSVTVVFCVTEQVTIEDSTAIYWTELSTKISPQTV